MSLDVDLMVDGKSYFSFNITHNLGDMADAAGLYKAMWRPEEIFDTKNINAKDIIPLLEKGVAELENPERKKEFKQLEPKNGWGNLEKLAVVARAYLRACKDLPHANVHTCK